ncbi:MULTISPECIES: HlyD family secretion protein [Shewanella]|uniref:HlyD family efflux transporter periplasmic adaptor subunit n=2 Tax=Shewanella TaxID=22 RepID=A0AAW8NSN0_9GAMM|nr:MULTISPECIES: HlyD family efflux transporter periplasmic adaptor subunit [Shewanella]MCL1140922.1 HlyD family efflux transporter periplasmic adaptor subunit [Shewanella pneumatophori]MDR8525805.1 HlyD family efflux transporter periplasmic adaptor subunit [Shewanella fidelis]MDW4812686.1 HlyD family efflux transporter periplasmic adaptor subunit [Shewanella fidelis]MDW4816434.1 HlyD family efflux transporter periplasmic adaptor subunit [Shewanella fidelis]MDW4820402.1 HlyD family efflux tran
MEIVRILMIVSVLFLLTACDSGSTSMALGSLERQRIALTATTNEVVVSLPVAQGSQVTQGTVLVQLDDTLQKANVAKALADVAQATANYEKLLKGAREEEIAAARAKVSGAKATLQESEANYRRIASMAKDNLASKADLDRALATRDSGVANLDSAQEQLRELVAGSREEDIRFALANLDATEAVLAGEQKKLADLTIRATRDGILDNLPWNLGERVTQGSPLAVVLAGKAPFARVYVPEPYRVKVSVGDALLVHVDGVDQPIEGKVSWIANEPAFSPYYALNQEERARLMYLAEVQLPDSAAQLPSGVPAQVEMP